MSQVPINSRRENLNAGTDRHSALTGHRRSRKILERTVQTTVACLVLTAVFAAYVLFASSVSSNPTQQSQRPQDADVGQVIVGEGSNCRKLRFDNSTGGFKDSG